jgi:hypothetical protein
VAAHPTSHKERYFKQVLEQHPLQPLDVSGGDQWLVTTS